jgi:spore coat protein U-like protein
MRFLPNMKFLTLAGVAGLALGLANQPTAQAATATGNLTVTANVLSACSVGNTTLDIGTYDSLTANAAAGVDKTETTPGTIAVTCATGTAFTVTLGNGLNFSGGRRMAHATAAGQFLNYNLFDGSAAAATPVAWPGAGKSGSGLGAATPVNFTVGGSAPKGQSPQGGAYSDTVVATVTF